MSKFKKLLRPRNIIIFFLVFSALVIFSGILATRAGLNYQFTRLNRGQELAIGSDYIAVGNLGGASRKIVNNSGTDYFVPTNSVNEWNRFLAAAPGLGVTVVSEFCGDGSCGTDRTNPSLPRAETYSWCPSDCLCGNGVCNYNYGENFDTCSTDCKVECEVDSYGNYCTSGPNCRLCHPPLVCAAGRCRTLIQCGNGSCESGETSSSCPSDCPWCPNGSCDNGETCLSCSADCGACPPGGACYDDSYCPYGQYCTGQIGQCTGDWYCDQYWSINDCNYGGCSWIIQKAGYCTY